LNKYKALRELNINSAGFKNYILDFCKVLVSGCRGPLRTNKIAVAVIIEPGWSECKWRESEMQLEKNEVQTK